MQPPLSKGATGQKEHPQRAGGSARGMAFKELTERGSLGPEAAKVSASGGGGGVASISPKGSSCQGDLEGLYKLLPGGSSDSPSVKAGRGVNLAMPSNAQDTSSLPGAAPPAQNDVPTLSGRAWTPPGSPYTNSSDEDTECIDMSPAREQEEGPGRCGAEEEHYITTHQIQLCELDHQEDGGSPSWWGLAGEDGRSSSSLLLGYASFDSDGTLEDTQTEGGDSYVSTASERNPSVQSSSELVSSGPERLSARSENDTPGGGGAGSAERGANAEETRARSRGPWGSSSPPAAGQTRLSITATPRAIKEARGQQHSSASARQEPGTMSQCASSNRAPERVGFGQPLLHLAHDQAKKMIAVPPARLHVRGAAVGGGYSSGASSAVSELDEADREVRSLTARAFRSLAYPYLDSLHFSSSESSASIASQSEQQQGAGLHQQWSTYLDWTGGAVVAQKSAQEVLQPPGIKGAVSAFGACKSSFPAQKSNIHINASQSSTKSLELVVSGPKQAQNAASSENLAQHSRVVTLQETLNLSCIAAASTLLPWNERPAQHAEGSLSVDEVTQPSSASISSSKAATGAPAEAMEQGTQKAKFACNLLQNVISKKMQLEQESKMERGEISDTSKPVPLSSSLTAKDLEALRREGGLQRQISRHSEGGSEYSLLSPEDFGAWVETNPPACRKDFEPQAGDVLPLPSEFIAVAAGAVSASEAARASLLRSSQRSAFRSWKEKEIQKLEQRLKEEKAASSSAATTKIKVPADYDWRADLGEIPGSRATKLSRLIVPGIQSIPKEKQPEKQATKYSASIYAHQSCFQRGEGDLRAQTAANTTPAAAARATPKLPHEVKVSLGADSKGAGSSNPFSIAKLLTPSLARAAQELKSQAASPSSAKGEPPLLERMPQFLVRDVRESKPNKIPGPLHQVRDVRKLMKSSYHPEESGARGAPSSSPMVITCQAVSKTKEEGEAAGARVRPSSPDTILVHRASGRLPVATIAPNKTGPRMPVVKIVSKACKWRQQQQQEEKPLREPDPQPAKPAAEPPKPSPPTTPHQALDKLTAAVKTMEQLYVFGKREWRRRSDGAPSTEGAPGSHLLSLIASEEGKGEEAAPPLLRRNSHPGAESTGKPQPPSPAGRTEMPPCRVEREPGRAQQPPPTSSSSSSKSTPGTGGSSFSTAPRTAPPAKAPQQQLRKSPRPLRVSQSLSLDEGRKPEPARGPPPARQHSTDCENYLSMPSKSKVEPAPPRCSLPPFPAKSPARVSPPEPRGRERAAPAAQPPPPPAPATPFYTQQPCLTPLLAGGPAAHLLFSPPLTAVPPELLQPQGPQRRLLLDLASGQYFLMDAPQPPARRRLFDPETGQYVDVPVPQQPGTPVPLSMPPMALSPGAYGAAYMIYPGFMPTATVLPALQRQLSQPGSEQSYAAGDYRDLAGGFADSPYYMPTGKPTAVQAQPGKPVVSSQQQPRILAPPSFDGTTMRFVVEHR